MRAPLPASLAARAERARSRLQQAGIERRARAELSETTVVRLEGLGLLRAIDERAVRSELRELEATLDALEELQTWVEAELQEASAA
jgi:hypothetical protein